MNEQKELFDPCCCYFHPREVVVGVCARCLHERLLVLASKQGGLSSSRGSDGGGQVSYFKALAKKSSVAIPKVFALSSFLYRSASRRQQKEEQYYYSDEEDSIPSLEDSFISIKFEDNGQASWERKPPTHPKQITIEQILSVKSNGSSGGSSGGGGIRSVVEHSKPKAAVKWSKKVGELFQVLRWKRASSRGAAAAAGAGASSSSSHGGLACRVETSTKGKRRGWMRSLTRRRMAPMGL